MNDTIISCCDVTKRFAARGKQTEVLSGVTLTVKAGHVVLIRGRSGTGKTTLLQILAGLDKPTSGHVEIAGQFIDKLNSKKLTQLRRDNIGFIFQNFNLLPSWTAQENVEAALIHTKLSLSKRRQKALELLSEMGLADRADHLPSELSIGQQQRVAVARALVNNPRIVFADEPTGDVDEETGGVVVESLVNLVRSHKASLVVCTHGGFSREIANEEYILSDGKIAGE